MEDNRVTRVYISLNPDLVNVLAKVFVNVFNHYNLVFNWSFLFNTSTDSTLLTAAGIRCTV